MAEHYERRGQLINLKEQHIKEGKSTVQDDRNIGFLDYMEAKSDMMKGSNKSAGYSIYENTKEPKAVSKHIEYSAPPVYQAGDSNASVGHSIGSHTTKKAAYKE